MEQQGVSVSDVHHFSSLFLCDSENNIGVSPSASCLSRWLGSLVYVRLRGPSSKPSYGAHWHWPTQPTTCA